MTRLSTLFGSGISEGATTGLPQLFPTWFQMDTVNTNVSNGTAFSTIRTLDFGADTTNGSIWVSFRLPLDYIDTGDLQLVMSYNLNASDDNKNVYFRTDCWCTNDGESVDINTPDRTNYDTISTGVSQDAAQRSINLSVIPAANLTSGDTITLKMTRDATHGNDTYTGTFQLIYVYPS